MSMDGYSVDGKEDEGDADISLCISTTKCKRISFWDTSLKGNPSWMRHSNRGCNFVIVFGTGAIFTTIIVPAVVALLNKYGGFVIVDNVLVVDLGGSLHWWLIQLRLGARLRWRLSCTASGSGCKWRVSLQEKVPTKGTNQLFSCALSVEKTRGVNVAEWQMALQY